MSARVVAALALCVLAAACSNEPDTHPDAAVRTGPSVEVGTGSSGFQELIEGQTIPFIQGPQGGGRYEGYHFWGAIRTVDYDPDEASIRLIYLRADDREEFARQERILPLQPAGDGSFVAWGFAPRIRDCCEVRNIEVIMRAEIEDNGGKSGFDEIRVRSQDSCLDILTDVSVCP